MAKKIKGPLLVRLRSGEELQIEKFGISGYVAAPIGALFLGGNVSRDVVGKFCVGVCYRDGQTGIIAQEEIAEITDAKGRPVPYGHAKYPGHPDFDPRDGFDPLQDQIDTLQRVSRAREERSRKIKEKGLAAVLEEEIRNSQKIWEKDSDKKKKKSKKKKSDKKKSKKKKSDKKKSKKKSKKS